MFGSSPNVNAHVDYMLSKVNRKLWTLRNIKKAGMSKDDMINVFNTIIRPVCDFASVTYHSMLTLEQSEEIERVQKRAMRIILGWDTNYRELIDTGKVESLKKRRERMTLNFAKKTESNPRFKKWFPRRNYNCLELRN